MARILTRKRIFVGLALAAVAAGASASLVRRAAPPPSVPLAFGCTPGETHVYSLDYTSDGALTDPSFGLRASGSAPEPEQRVHAAVRGALTTTCVARTTEEHTVAMTFDVPEGALALPDGTEQRAAELLGGTTFVTRDARGHTKAIRFPAEMPEAGRNVVRDMLTLGQITLPASPAPTWSAEEIETSGPFEADYAVRAIGSDQVTLAKTRRGRPPHGQLRTEALRPHAEIDGDSAGGTIHIHHVLGADDFLWGLDVTVPVALKVGSRTVGRTRGHLAVSHRAQSQADADALSLMLAERAKGAQSDLAASDVDARLERRMQEDELGTDTWKTLSGRLDASAADRTKVYLKLKALFLLHPETCSKAGLELVATEDTHSTRFHLLAGALTAAGTKEAQQALVAAVRGSAGKLAHERALVGSLGMLKAPTKETIAELRTLRDSHAVEEVRGSARLALGSLAKADPAQARQIVDSEIAAYRAANNGDDRALSLLALGNTGADDLLAIAREAFQDPDPHVRAAAASSLRFVTAGDAEDLLVSIAQKDSAATVRAEALHALGYRILGAPALEAVTAIVRSDPEEDVRMAAVQIIAKEIGHDGSLEGVLEEVTRTERAKGVRNAAQLALVRYRATAGN